MRLEGKVALISGSTRGIGRTTAELFAAEGAKVVVSGRTVEKGEKVAQNIRHSGGDAIFVRLDVSDEESVQAAIDATVERYGTLTTLINNAATTDIVNRNVKPMTEYTNDEWDSILRGTLTGNVFWMTKHALPHLIAAGGGSIVNVSSGAAIFGVSGISAYTAAKGGVNALTRAIAVESAKHNIRCNVIVVGRVVSHSRDRGPDVHGGLTRVGRPSDIAYLAMYLASDESEFVTGSEIVADGGQAINGDGGMSQVVREG
jgi:NAD(P)-dependent dehydrogenase (short-subunit alcohol dehydrogenase family)